MKRAPIPLAACAVDPDGTILRWSRACEQFTGYPAAEVRGKAVQDLLLFDSPRGATVSIATRADTAALAELVCADGRKLPVRVTVSPESLDQEGGQNFSLVMLPVEPLPPRPALIRELPIGDIIEDLPCVFYVIDETGHLMLWNRLLQDALQRTPEELHCTEVKYFYDEEIRGEVAQFFIDALAHGESTHEADLVGKYGRRATYMFHCCRTYLAGKPCIFGTGLDISARKQVEHGLRVRERALYSSVNAIVITVCDNGNHLIEYVNPAFEQITGYMLEEIKGRDPRFMRVEGCDVHEHERIRSALKRKESVRSVLRNARKNGEIFWNDLRIDPVATVDGDVTHFVAVISDVTEARHYERRLHHLAHHDPLTGLANRTLLLDRLRFAVDFSVRHGVTGALAFLDLDNFKHINDNFGHDAGDAVLREIAERLRTTMREDDLVARIGGDEFVLLIHEQPTQRHVGDLLERVRRSVSAPVLVGGREIIPGTSIGVSLFPQDGDNVDRVMRAADAAMYHAKSLGKNNIQFYSAELGQAMHQHLLLQASLSRAIRNDEMVLGYQPKVDLRTGKVIGAEALVRWNRPEHGEQQPDSFIPMAEETGLIVPLGEWVIQEACRTLKSLAAAGICDLVISVNLSARQLRQRDFAKRLAATLGRYGVAPEHLELEVTESQLMDNPADAMDALKQLKELGVRLSIDDFGTGYSSLSHLRKFPVDYIKIDRSFLSDLYADDHAVIPRAIIALGHNLRLQVVAEGVETEEQLSFLRDHGCDQMQGFYFSPAIPCERLKDMVRRDTRLSA
ncbi:bifunctional diguanylate cyclase/phosphodiesterase [Massilia sp. ST3]|uniref:sensor domain-containing protein n=1 Tax=Massilia sp. ST3 TaxID=2824903 RepID=UPI001B811957|nr:EAL domain-containing protein [Massilia sp. ST3]